MKAITRLPANPLDSGKGSSVTLAALLLLGMIAPGAGRADRLWWDGSRDAQSAAPGKLLSDNANFWGDAVPTGVTYTYEAAPDAPADIVADDKARFGRRLLDGAPLGDRHVPVGLVNKPLAVTFDFKRPCAFGEIDVVTQSNRAAVTLEVADAPGGPWRPAGGQPLAQSADRPFHRLPLAAPARGRWLRVTVNAVDPARGRWITYLNEVLAWGDAAPAPRTAAPESAFGGVTGVKESAFSPAQFAAWRRRLGAQASAPAVWAPAPTWGDLTHRPLLPDPARIDAPVAVEMARNETECAALTLTNTSGRSPARLAVRLGAFRRVSPATPVAGRQAGAVPKLTGTLRVGGAIKTRWAGVGIGPLFEADNKLGPGLMRRYLTDGADVEDFPRLTLPPAGSAVLWLSVRADGAAPGLYEAALSGAGRPLAVRVRVLDVTLPRPPVWLQTWSGTTGMFPFVFGDRRKREVAYKQSLGVSVWNGLPTPGSDGALARQSGRAQFQTFILPPKYVDDGYNNRLKPDALTPADEAAVAAHVHDVVRQAQNLGLTYDDWYGELWDEPGRGNAAALGALARMVKRADPRVRLYANPAFWEGAGAAPDAAVRDALAPWFGDVIDVSVPLKELLPDRPQSFALFDAPRAVRAFYGVTTHGTKGEAPDKVAFHRRMAWDAFRRGWNGWGFFSYYGPLGDPWDDLDRDLPDYEMVFPGPRGPVPTRISESVREGWEDFRLLTLLKQQGRTPELSAILKSYAAGAPLPELRLRALRAAASPAL